MTGGEPLVRDARESDAAACAAIYAPYVTDTAISFETEPPTPAEMAERIAAANRAHAWLVLEDAGQVVGYAYGGPFCPGRPTGGPAWSASTSSATGAAVAAAEPCTRRCSPDWPSAATERCWPA